MRTVLFTALLLVCSVATAGSIIGNVSSSLDEPLNIDPNATISVRVEQAVNVSNANFHARNFTEALQRKFPNAYFDKDRETTADHTISLFLRNSDKESEGTETQYSKTPSEWKCNH